MMVGDSKIRVKVPNYSETDSNCPAVEHIKIYDKDCLTISTAFENANDLMSTLSGGFLFANLVNIEAPQTYEFCIKVTSFHSITIPDLTFVL